MKKIMVLGASELQVPIIKKIKELGYYSIAVDQNKKAIGFNFANQNINVSTMDKEKVLQVAKDLNVDGILTAASDQPMNTVAYVAENLNLCSISINAARNTTNKYLMREELRKKNIPIPRYYLVKDYDEFKLVIKKFEDDFIVKPVDSSGSRGVYFCNNDTKNFNEIYKNTVSNSRTKTAIVEEFMSGQEVSVETFSNLGKTIVIAVTDKITSGIPHFVELSHSQPSELDESTLSKVENLAVKTVEALGIKNGPSHVEIMVTKEGPKIIEIGARLGGDNITSHLVPLSTGVDMLAATINSSLGIEPNLLKTKNNFSKIIYFQSRVGLFKSVKGLESILKRKEVIEIKFLKEFGERLTITDSSSNRIGYIIFSSDSKEKIESAVEFSKETLEIEIIKIIEGE